MRLWCRPNQLPIQVSVLCWLLIMFYHAWPLQGRQALPRLFHMLQILKCFYADQAGLQLACCQTFLNGHGDAIQTHAVLQIHLHRLGRCHPICSTRSSMRQAYLPSSSSLTQLLRSSSRRSLSPACPLHRQRPAAACPMQRPPKNSCPGLCSCTSSKHITASRQPHRSQRRQQLFPRLRAAVQHLLWLVLLLGHLGLRHRLTLIQGSRTVPSRRCLGLDQVSRTMHCGRQQGERHRRGLRSNQASGSSSSNREQHTRRRK